LLNPLYTIPLTNTYYNTLINPTIIIEKDSYFTLPCLKLKDIGNIKEIEEEKVSNKLEKEEPPKKTLP